MRRAIEQEEIPASEEEQAIAEVLGENPRALELQLMRQALEQRRDGMQRDKARTKDPADQTRLQAKIQELGKQIDVLRQEEGITRFVENSVRVTLHRAGGEEFDEE